MVNDAVAPVTLLSGSKSVFSDTTIYHVPAAIDLLADAVLAIELVPSPQNTFLGYVVFLKLIVTV